MDGGRRGGGGSAIEYTRSGAVLGAGNRAVLSGVSSQVRRHEFLAKATLSW